MAKVYLEEIGLLRYGLTGRESNLLYMKSGITKVLNHHLHIFQETLGTLQDYETQLYVDPQAKPKAYLLN